MILFPRPPAGEAGRREFVLNKSHFQYLADKKKPAGRFMSNPRRFFDVPV
jgi:hypothetical protein